MKNKTFASRLRAWLNDLPIPDPVNRRMAALVQVMLIGFIAIIVPIRHVFIRFIFRILLEYRNLPFVQD